MPGNLGTPGSAPGDRIRCGFDVAFPALGQSACVGLGQQHRDAGRRGRPEGLPLAARHDDAQRRDSQLLLVAGREAPTLGVRSTTASQEIWTRRWNRSSWSATRTARTRRQSLPRSGAVPRSTPSPSGTVSRTIAGISWTGAEPRTVRPRPAIDRRDIRAGCIDSGGGIPSRHATHATSSVNRQRDRYERDRRDMEAALLARLARRVARITDQAN